MIREQYTNTLADLTETKADIDFVLENLNLKAPKETPVLTGTPQAPTATPGTNTTQIATTAFVVAALAELPPDIYAFAAAHG